MCLCYFVMFCVVAVFGSCVVCVVCYCLIYCVSVGVVFLFVWCA